jgi:hypothetical protein
MTDAGLHQSLIIPPKPRFIPIVYEKGKYDSQRMLYKIYFTLINSNHELKWNPVFQIYLIYFAWIKIFSYKMSVIKADKMTSLIHSEFFFHLSDQDFQTMLSKLRFSEVGSSEYFLAFCKIIERVNHIDWDSLIINGCADYDFEYENISHQLEKMKELTVIFNKYI